VVDEGVGIVGWALVDEGLGVQEFFLLVLDRRLQQHQPVVEAAAIEEDSEVVLGQENVVGVEEEGVDVVVEEVEVVEIKMGTRNGCQLPNWDVLSKT